MQPPGVEHVGSGAPGSPGSPPPVAVIALPTDTVASVSTVAVYSTAYVPGTAPAGSVNSSGLPAVFAVNEPGTVTVPNVRPAPSVSLTTTSLSVAEFATVTVTVYVSSWPAVTDVPLTGSALLAIVTVGAGTLVSTGGPLSQSPTVTQSGSPAPVTDAVLLMVSPANDAAGVTGMVKLTGGSESSRSTAGIVQTTVWLAGGLRTQAAGRTPMVSPTGIVSVT